MCANTTDRIKSEQRLTVNAVITQGVGATSGITFTEPYPIPASLTQHDKCLDRPVYTKLLNIELLH